MENTVWFRPFNLDDVDFIFKIKNDINLNKLIVGHFNSFSYDDAIKWVKGCMTENPDFKFWVISPMNSNKAIGYCSLVSINYINQSAETGAIVIADSEYNDGFAWIEGVLFMLEYGFEVLNLNRIYGKSLVGHKMSNKIAPLMYMQIEGIMRQAVFKNGQFYDLQYIGILKNEYFEHKSAGDYEIRNLIRRLRKLRHE